MVLPSAESARLQAPGSFSPSWVHAIRAREHQCGFVGADQGEFPLPQKFDLGAEPTLAGLPVAGELRPACVQVEPERGRPTAPPLPRCRLGAPISAVCATRGEREAGAELALAGLFAAGWSFAPCCVQVEFERVNTGRPRRPSSSGPPISAVSPSADRATPAASRPPSDSLSSSRRLFSLLVDSSRLPCETPTRRPRTRNRPGLSISAVLPSADRARAHAEPACADLPCPR